MSAGAVIVGPAVTVGVVNGELGALEFLTGRCDGFGWAANGWSYTLACVFRCWQFGRETLMHVGGAGFRQLGAAPSKRESP